VVDSGDSAAEERIDVRLLGIGILVDEEKSTDVGRKGVERVRARAVSRSGPILGEVVVDGDEG